MSRTTQMQIRIEPELKAEAEAVLSRLGLKPTEYIRMALSQLVLRKGLPFDARIPNEDTIAALEEPAHNLRQFDSTREVFADLANLPLTDEQRTELDRRLDAHETDKIEGREADEVIAEIKQRL